MGTLVWPRFIGWNWDLPHYPNYYHHHQHDYYYYYKRQKLKVYNYMQGHTTKTAKKNKKEGDNTLQYIARMSM